MPGKPLCESTDLQRKTRSALSVACWPLPRSFVSQQFTSTCSIAVLRATIPTVIVAANLVALVPVPRSLKRLLHPITDIAHDRTSLENIAPANVTKTLEQSKHVGPTYLRQAILLSVGMVGSLWWAAMLGLRIIKMMGSATRPRVSVWPIWTTALILLSWVSHFSETAWRSGH